MSKKHRNNVGMIALKKSLVHNSTLLILNVETIYYTFMLSLHIESSQSTDSMIQKKANL